MPSTCRRVPHPCAFCAQGWDSTDTSRLGLSLQEKPVATVQQSVRGTRPSTQQSRLRMLGTGHYDTETHNVRAFAKGECSTRRDFTVGFLGKVHER